MLACGEMYLSDWKTNKEFGFLDGFIESGVSGNITVIDFRKAEDRTLFLLSETEKREVTEYEYMQVLFKNEIKGKNIIYNGIVDNTNIRVLKSVEELEDFREWHSVLITLENIE
ncbi:hypothetical protein NE686_17625 [Tissierella carlieri]|uniref:Uncharacterized protein n=1 Tax=Tissierella carlieri TaxID=689904 RepID=A0ABT1SEL8_9FIRM|nr:hypothetical protein [Tissierella carlieri]MCQ4924926.1 hypothetical protein [Tissierella carlieri]